METTCYPVQKTELCCEDYNVWVNGEPVQTNVARVSAYPFNRRWPGYQRQIEQTELIQFLSLSMDAPTVIELEPKAAFDTFCVRPKNAPVTAERTPAGRIRLEVARPAYFTVEPFGRNHAFHVFADAPADPVQGEKLVCFGAGVHDVGVLWVESGQTVVIDAGAVVYGSIRAKDAHNIRITGRGILDNSRNRETIFYEAHVENNEQAVLNAERTHTIQLEYCDHVEIDGITIRDSLLYNIRPICCTDLHIHDVKAIGCWRYNSDGIDMHNCEDVLIEHCFLRTFDDSICVKGLDYTQSEEDMERNGRRYDVFRNVLVKNCVIWNDWGKALEIGAETHAKEICDIRFTDCDIIHVTGNALDCLHVDDADIHDVTYDHIRVEFDPLIPEPIIQKNDREIYETPKDFVPRLIGVRIEFNPEYSFGGNQAVRGRARRLTFSHITVDGWQRVRVNLQGYSAEYPVEDILIEDIVQNGKRLRLPEDIELRQNEFCANITLR